jgi:hypothetical protein
MIYFRAVGQRYHARDIFFEVGFYSFLSFVNKYVRKMNKILKCSGELPECWEIEL